MMKKLACLVGIMALGALVLPGCFMGEALASGSNITTRSFEYTDFTAVEIGGAFEFEIVQSAEHDIQISANQDYVSVEQFGRTLRIGRKHLSWTPVFHEYRAVISMPSLENLKVSGASKGIAGGFDVEQMHISLSGASQLEIRYITLEEADIELSGASRLNGIINAAGRVEFEISGASRVEVDGAAESIVLAASGASQVDIGSLAAGDGNVNLSGASQGTVRFSGELDAELSGASRLELYGGALIDNLVTSGNSRINRK